ncbi:DUF6115 domain-containing protein [Salibacterium qingdaonense]|uniref:Swarming motility protein SwrB n=1 Tax=Salibacterium qingdaonense TaxID=266892 RepID=A0A1I4PR57_9BACI|nr:hypothetical protein [Salibacterium qingdaonense]SFM30322.1 hypothetical protein SAMN04488054_13034 [Salibacterium qingdaonense]
MTLVVLVFSLALHALTFFVLVRFYSHVQNVKEESRQLHGMREDLEEILRQYTEEIKQENQELKDSLHSYADQNAGSAAAHEAPAPVEKDPQPHAFQKRAEEAVEHAGTKEAEDSFSPPPPPDEDQMETSNQAKVLSLSARGYTRDEIAKELQIGKGEVDLFLKFYLELQ